MNYAVIENGKVVNVVIAEPEFAQSQGWVECPVGGIGWDYDGTTFIDNRPVVEIQPATPTKEELLQQVQDLSEKIQSLT